MRDKVNQSITATFEHGNANWARQLEYNMFFLRAQQNYANELLRIRGFLVLNDVLGMLGFERTREGMILGWDGEDVIDFGFMHEDGGFPEPADKIELTFNVKDIYHQDEEKQNG